MAEIQEKKVYCSELVLNKSLSEEHNRQGTGLWQKLSVFDQVYLAVTVF